MQKITALLHQHVNPSSGGGSLIKASQRIQIGFAPDRVGQVKFYSKPYFYNLQIKSEQPHRYYKNWLQIYTGFIETDGNNAEILQLKELINRQTGTIADKLEQLRAELKPVVDTAPLKLSAPLQIVTSESLKSKERLSTRQHEQRYNKEYSSKSYPSRDKTRDKHTSNPSVHLSVLDYTPRKHKVNYRKHSSYIEHQPNITPQNRMNSPPNLSSLIFQC